MSTPTAPISAAPASAAAPVAAATPSPVSSPAAAATPVTPTTPTPTTPAAPAEMDHDQRVAAMVATAAEKMGEKPAATVEAPKVEEKPAVETPAAEKKEEPAVAATDADDESFSMADESFSGARDLAAELDAVAGLSGLLPKETRDKIMANARIAERLAPYEQIFASPDEAKVIVETANEHAGFAEAFSAISRDAEKGTNAFVAKLIEGSALRDADGNVRKDANGNVMTDGTAGRFFDKIFERGFALKVAKKVEALNDENVTAAFDLVMESVGLRPSTAAQDQAQDPALAARKAELDAQEARIRTERQTANTEAQKSHQAAVDGETTSSFESSLTSLLSQATALSALEQSAVQGKIEAAFSAALKRGNPASTAYYQRLDRIRQEPLSATRRQKEVALAKQFTRDNLVRIARPFFKEAGVVVGQKAEERAAAQAARAEAARSEVSGGRAATPAVAGPGDVAQQEARAVEAFKAANGGRAPADDAEKRIGMMLAHAKARGIAA